MALRVLVLSLILFLLASCDCPNQGSSLPGERKVQVSQNVLSGELSLFDGKSLGKWKVTEFAGRGKVYVKDESIMLGAGESLSGVTWGGDVVRMNYQIGLDAMRVEGNDFFCGLTFPAGDSCVTFIAGGWAGSVCGISSVNYFDASDNETTVKSSFENGRWYHIRIRVSGEKIECWIDEKKYVDLETNGKHLGVRRDVEDSQPLGIASFRSAAAIKNIRLTKLPDNSSS